MCGRELAECATLTDAVELSHKYFTCLNLKYTNQIAVIWSYLDKYVWKKSVPKLVPAMEDFNRKLNITWAKKALESEGP